LDFEIKFFCDCFVALGLERGFVNISSWYTHRFLDHLKETKNDKNMGFEIRKGFKFFLQNIWNKVLINLQLQFLLHGV
jgi:hypothetical protein